MSTVRTLPPRLLPLLLALAMGCGGGAPPAPTAVILIVVDTLRADRLAVGGAARPVMPRMDEWLDRAVVFEQARAPSPWTLPSFASAYTGLYPVRHGARVRDRTAKPRTYQGPSPDVRALSEILTQQGWETSAFVANEVLGPQFGVARGFDRYDQLQPWGDVAPRSPATVDAALDWIGTRDEAPFFLVLHLMDPHIPYDPPDETRGRFSGNYAGDLRPPFDKVRKVRTASPSWKPEDRSFVEATYDEDIAFADGHLGRFLDELQARGLLDRTLVIFTADHGEEFWEHGGFEHGHTLFDELLRVPLAMWAPGVEPRRDPTPVTLTDLMPTVLDAADLPVPDGLDGVSLWPLVTGGVPPEPRALLAESTLYGADQRAVIAWPWKLIDLPAENRRELYQLQDDPGETEDVAAARPEVTRRLAAVVAESFVPADVAEPAEVKLDAEALEKLRALGYVE